MLVDMLRSARKNVGFFKVLFFGTVVALIGLNFIIRVHHPHFQLERYPGFWVAFGLAGAVTMVLVLKKVIFHIIGKQEDFYDRNS